MAILLKSVHFTPFKAEGQKMFGETPKEHWKQFYPSDDYGICKWALRSLIINYNGNIVLIDCGFGNLNKKIVEEYSISNFENTDEIIRKNEFSPLDVKNVIFTHLHLDHCGGSFKENNKGDLEPVFSHASYTLSKQQLISAKNPSPFEKESFQPEIVKAISKYSKLNLITKNCFLFPWLELRVFNGHTNGLLVPIIHLKNKSIVFAGDIIPSAAHMTLSSIMSYNVDKNLSLKEQREFLKECLENNYLIFFLHDYYNECCNIKLTNNKIVADKFYRICEFTEN